MKAILEFNLPEDDYEYKCATNGMKYKAFLYDFYDRMKWIVKNSDETCKTAGDAFDLYMSMLNENNINIFED